MRFRRPHVGVLPALVLAGAGAAAGGRSSDFDGTPTAFGVGLRDHLRTLP